MDGNNLISRITAFEVGDEVRNEEQTDKNFIITAVDLKHKMIYGIGPDGISFMDSMPTKWHPTGRKYPELALFMKNLQNNQ